MDYFESNYDFIPLEGYEDFEATTQLIIKELLNRDIEFEVLSTAQNLIVVYHENKEFIIKEGTISDANSLISFWISNDKWLTKLFLKRAGVNVAEGQLITDEKSFDNCSIEFPVVVKPKDTDHGIGITTNITDKESFERAVAKAFQYANQVIVERYFTGREYRFLVVENVVRAVAYRIPANVVGDGEKNIGELIKQKNKNRGNDYRTPLLKLEVDDEVERVLKSQNLNLHSIPDKNTLVSLRNNSNLSTGGDSIDVTDEMSDFYKEIAVKATQASGLKIAGVDIIIQNIDAEPSKTNHIVVELNAPAMLSMHSYPYKGKNRQVEKYVLDAILNSK
ncbi:glutamate--cysteine ligase [Balneicella halophila]|uniref:Glutamate--cysteine ligase n=1 Tax=Balneicella halophila TaxID=1537566 RepID=A0A7L4UMA3_BALHA|nr:glutamate ligase [Balneicella halophila]PVX49361.1 glutamate--cysteine ligase [Balneicella halophila]